MQSDYDELKNKVEQLQRQYEESKRMEEYYRMEYLRCKNSIRLQIGSEIVDSMHSLSRFLRLPYSLSKLYKESNDKKKKMFQLEEPNKRKLNLMQEITVALVVSQVGEKATAGDYFTAKELAVAFESLGAKVLFLSRQGKKDWYRVGKEVDLLISLLDEYDVSRVYHASKDLITVAWARNWFERWCDQKYIGIYNYIFASSNSACKFMKERLQRDIYLLPLATNQYRFMSVTKENESKSIGKQKEFYKSDYVFTGSYWGEERDLLTSLNPEKLPYCFKIYGKNWERINKFKRYFQGFVAYENMPLVYKGTRIVIDDANRPTKYYGSVNSRVFDAIAAGRLVITNGDKGSMEIFQGKLPFYSNEEELQQILTYYMTNQNAYSEKVKELQKIVLNNHTYEIRVRKILSIIGAKECFLKEELK